MIVTLTLKDVLCEQAMKPQECCIKNLLYGERKLSRQHIQQNRMHLGDVAGDSNKYGGVLLSRKYGNHFCFDSTPKILKTRYAF